MNNNWNILNNKLIYYLQYNSLPNLLAVTIAYLYYYDLECDNFDYLYNNIKSYINICNEDKNNVLVITKNILKNKYSLIIYNYFPLIIKSIK